MRHSQHLKKICCCCADIVSINRVKLKYQNDSVEIMQCTVKYITSSAILVLPLLLLFLPTLISSLSRRDCLPTLTGTFDNHIIGMCLLCLYEVSIYEIFLRGRARTLYTYSRGDFALRVVHHHHPHHNFEIHLQFYLYENELLYISFYYFFW